MTVRPSMRLGRYTVGAHLHEGGMAHIYAVKTQRGRMPLVLKTPKLGREHPLSSLMAFENEQRVLARLTGPHVPRLLASGGPHDIPYLIMERIEGDALARAVARAPVSFDSVRKLGIQMCRAVHALHHQNVIHLDLNPSNLRNRADGEMVIIDFGLAYHAQLPDLHDAAFGEEEGTTPYIAPEQLQHVRTDSRSDVYAIGAMLYQLSTGQYPHGRPNMLSLAKRLAQSPIPPRVHRPDLPPWLQDIILRCLEIYPEKRFATAKEIAYLLAHPEAVHIGQRGRRLRGPNIWEKLYGWSHSLFLNFQRRTSTTRPYERLTKHPHVLIALDLERSSEALREALRRAVRRLAHSEPHSYFTCLSVLTASERVQPGGSTGPDVIRQLSMRDWAKPLKFNSTRLVYQVLPGDPAKAIVTYASTHQVDLIVIGARASSAWRQHLGSVSAAVAAQAPCSVIVVRTRRDTKSVRK